MNEVVPWSTRARGAVGPSARRAGRTVARWWAASTDLGVGAVLFHRGGLVAAGIAVAVVEGRGGPGARRVRTGRPGLRRHPRPRMGRQGALSSAQVARLQEASGRLASLAATARGDDAKAITDAAAVADGVTAGRELDASHVVIEFEAACSQDGPHGGDLRGR